MNRVKAFLKAACLTLLAASCNNVIDSNETIGSGQMFEASFVTDEDQTRVSLDSELRKVSWEDTDVIGIFDAGMASPVKAAVASIEDAGAKAIFSPVTTVVNPVFAVHPYMASSTISGESVTVTVPSASSGDFSESCIAVAKADDGKFAFKTAVAIFRFKVSDPAVRSVIISGSGIAGDVEAAIDQSGNLTVVPAGSGSDEITVSDVVPDQICHVAVVPQEYEGLTFTYRDKDGNELGVVKCSDRTAVAPGDLMLWGDFAQYQKAYLPKGEEFNSTLRTLAESLKYIKGIEFKTGYKPAGTIINEGMEGAPIGAEFSEGTIFICTPANEFVANPDMSGMFCDMKKLETISGFDKVETSGVKKMVWLFDGCESLKSVDLSHLNTSNVIDMLAMFYECKSITSLDLSMFDVSNVECMQAMFANMENLTSLDISGFNTSKVTNMDYMFKNCYRLPEITFGPSFEVNGSTSEMFASLGTENSTPYTTFFCNVDQWKKVSELIGTANIVNYRWGNAPAAANLPSGLNFNMALRSAAGGTSNNIKTITFETLSSRTGTVINNGHGDTPVYVSYSSGAITVSTPAAGFNANANSSGMFENMTNLTAINNLASVNTSNVTDMDAMFGYCESLASIDLSNFNTAKVVNMFGMFYENNALTSLDLSEFDTSKVEEMSSMFYGCKKLTSLDLSGFNTAKALRMCYMFRWCESLK